jgi:parvulin-like peptidyl-prolyl isomerase
MYPRRRLTIVSLVALAGAVTVIGAALAACGGADGPTASPSSDTVVAVVNGRPVHESDVAVVRSEKRFLGQPDTAAAALKEAIDRALVRSEATRLGAVAQAGIVRKSITDLTSEVGGAAALKTSLGRAATSAAQLRQSVTDGVLREAVQNAEFPTVVAGPKAARAYYVRHRKDTFTEAAAVHLRAIAVRTEGVAKNALGRLRQGHSFAEVAHQFSIDPVSRDAGGDLGLLLVSSLPGSLRKAAASAHLGVLAEPVQVGTVSYVLDVLARHPARVIPYAKVRTRIQEELTRVKRAKALEAWLVTVRKGALIERL